MRPLKLGIACYPTFGGSGVVATEIGLGMARRGHEVHLFAYERPARLLEEPEGLVFHQVEVRSYPVFHQPPYELALASLMVKTSREFALELMHVHYAVPHATSAFVAASVLGDARPKIITTLHGTDITLVGSDPNYLPITRFSIEQSDAVTAPSEWLAGKTQTLLDLPGLPVEVIPNFIDCARFSPCEGRAPLGERPWNLVHVSNFRKVKRVGDAVRVLAEVRRQREAELYLIGDGPEMAEVRALVVALGLEGQVHFIGEKYDVRPYLGQADIFLLPSESESFGVAALEAQAMGIPVVGSEIGGVPEVIADGESGLLRPVGDIQGMSAAVIALLTDPSRYRAFAKRAREIAFSQFRMDAVLDRYEALYRRMRHDE